MNSAILGVGTELTDGQIVNSNAAWLSRRLKSLGARTTLHLTVPDERTLILQGLGLCADKAELIFITGGLGPTSDDFTRDLVAEWSGCDLEFHEPSWKMVREKLEARGYPLQDIQKQQCFFPRGAEILINSQGTANGFRLRARDRDLVVLPGPPREIEALWNDHLAAWLDERCAGRDPMVTRSWDLIGLGESQVATLVEPLVQNACVEVGYRVHLPYVEVKIAHPVSRTAECEPLIQKLQEVLGARTVSRDGADVATAFASLLRAGDELTIVDEVSGGFLLGRLQSPLRKFFSEGRWQFKSSGDTGDRGLGLWIRAVDEHTARVGWKRDRQIRETVLEAPMRSAVLAERRRQYFAEAALAFWAKSLRD